MKILIILVFFLSVYMPSEKSKSSSNIVFKGSIVKIGPKVSPSGDTVNYQLVKYKIDEIYKGTYKKDIIIVDHLILFGNELESFRANDEVIVVVNKTKKISLIQFAEGIREVNSKVKNFYIAKELMKNCND